MAPTSRRALLQAGFAVGSGALLSGCGVDWRAVRIDTGASEKPPSFSRDELARFAAIERVSVLAEQADLVAATAPATRELAAAHQTQLTQLGGLPGPVPSASVTPRNWPSTPTESPKVDAAGLVAAETAAATAMLRSLDGLAGRSVRLLASVAVGCHVGAMAFASAAKISEPQELPLPQQDDELSGPLPEHVVKAARDLVAAEDYAGYAYGPDAVMLSAQSRAQGATMMAEHTRRAQHLRALLHSAGTDLPAAPAAYQVSRPTDEVAAKQAMADLEKDCAYAAGALLATGEAKLRPLALSTLVAAATQQWRWSRTIAALPAG